MLKSIFSYCFNFYCFNRFLFSSLLLNYFRTISKRLPTGEVVKVRQTRKSIENPVTNITATTSAAATATINTTKPIVPSRDLTAITTTEEQFNAIKFARDIALAKFLIKANAFQLLELPEFKVIVFFFFKVLCFSVSHNALDDFSFGRKDFSYEYQETKKLQSVSPNSFEMLLQPCTALATSLLILWLLFITSITFKHYFSRE